MISKLANAIFITKKRVLACTVKPILCTTYIYGLEYIVHEALLPPSAVKGNLSSEA